MKYKIVPELLQGSLVWIIYSKAHWYSFWKYESLKLRQCEAIALVNEIKAAKTTYL